jgi:hypothetical protein
MRNPELLRGSEERSTVSTPPSSHIETFAFTVVFTYVEVPT